jgi:hypothetical protein
MPIKAVMRSLLPDPEVEVETGEVLKDLHKRPNLFVRVKISGMRFPHRAPEPFVRVGDVTSRFAEISDDELTLRGYFDRPIPARGPVCFGYGNEVLYCTQRDLPLGELSRLDRKLIPRETLIPWEQPPR